LPNKKAPLHVKGAGTKGPKALIERRTGTSGSRVPDRAARDGRAIPFVSDFFDFSVYLHAGKKSRKMVRRPPHAAARQLISESFVLFQRIRELDDAQAETTPRDIIAMLS